jgi:hypothetical protein
MSALCRSESAEPMRKMIAWSDVFWSMLSLAPHHVEVGTVECLLYAVCVFLSATEAGSHCYTSCPCGAPVRSLFMNFASSSLSRGTSLKLLLLLEVVFIAFHMSLCARALCLCRVRGCAADFGVDLIQFNSGEPKWGGSGGFMASRASRRTTIICR